VLLSRMTDALSQGPAEEWRVEAMGHVPVLVPTPAAGSDSMREARAEVQFVLPRDAKQGDATWYLLHLHFRLRLRQSGESAAGTDSGSSFAVVSADVNGRTGAQMSFRPVTWGPEWLEGTRSAVKWETVDLLHGSNVGIVDGRTVELQYANFVQRAAVRPGASVLTFRVEEFGLGGWVEGLEILPDSSVIEIRYGPPQIEVETVSMKVADDGNVRVEVELTTGTRRIRSEDIVLALTRRAEPDVPPYCVRSNAGPRRARNRHAADQSGSYWRHRIALP